MSERQTPSVAGDDIRIGDITDSDAVAVGRHATAVKAEHFHYHPTRLTKGEAHDRRNRTILRQKVRTFWIEGVLERSVHGAALIALDKQAQPDAVPHPWSTIVEDATGEPWLLPPGTSMLDLLTASGRALLILGAPGGGKTTTLLELAREALDRADDAPAEPIPVVFNLSSWRRGTLADWLVSELSDRYQVPRAVGRPWIADDDLLLLLDGLDEVAPERQNACAAAINHFRSEHGLAGMVVCCRAAEYRALSAPLRLSGAVRLQPLTADQVHGYLATLGPRATHVRTALQQDVRLQELAASPLLLGIMVLAYQDAAADGRTAGVTFGSTADAQHRLFGTYVQRMLTRRPASGGSVRYPADQTLHWLTWLAVSMAARSESVFHLERLQPDWLATREDRRCYALVDRLGSGLAMALAVWLLFGLLAVVGNGLASFGWSAAGGQGSPGWGTFLLLALTFGLVCGAVGGLFGGTGAGLGAAGAARPRLGQMIRQSVLGWIVVGTVGTAGALLASGPTGLASYFWTGPLALTGPTDRYSAIMFGSGAGVLVVAVLLGFGFGLAGGLTGGLTGPPGLGPRRIAVVETVRWSFPRAARAAGGALLVGGVAGAVIGFLMGLVFQSFWLVYGLSRGVSIWRTAEFVFWESEPDWLSGEVLGGLALGLFGGVAFALLHGVVGGLVGGVIEVRVRPNQGIWRSLRTALLVAVGCGLLYPLVEGLAATPILATAPETRRVLSVALATAPLDVVVGAVFGLLPSTAPFMIVGGLAYGGYACLSHVALRLVLWHRGAMPLRYGRFLDYGVERIFLQRVGGGYIFVHRLLMDYFASLNTEPSAGK